MTELLRHPEALRKVQKRSSKNRRQQIKARVTRDDLAKMNYLKAALKESMRLHPSVPIIPRASTQDVVVNGFTIPASTRILIHIWAIGTDPELWEEPEKFDPREIPQGRPCRIFSQ
uniref:Cytochrome P450 n=1 Tax=Kalanchoe fedtschenkoi TaxID=63787 RepID=A0A7N0VEE1_KALFE